MKEYKREKGDLEDKLHKAEKRASHFDDQIILTDNLLQQVSSILVFVGFRLTLVQLSDELAVIIGEKGGV